MTTSPLLRPQSHTAHSTPSPSASPSLRPLASSMAKSPSPSLSPFASGNVLPLSLSSPKRSFARAAPIRPYSVAAPGPARKPVEGDTKRFADSIAGLVEDRGRRARLGMLSAEVIGDGGREGRSLGGSLAGSWEKKKIELIVDIPVWSPGCFQDLSTLHALRDTTLSHTHSLLAYLIATHSIPASYRLLARSATSTSSPSSLHARPCPGAHPNAGWGCIRLAPSSQNPASPTQRRELKPKVRRSSTTFKTSPTRVRKSPIEEIPTFKLDLDEAIAEDSDEEDHEKIELRKGYRSAGGSDDEGDDPCADILIAREVERRCSKEGSAFLMTLFGQPALILT